MSNTNKPGGPDNQNPRLAEARKATDALIAAAVPIFVPERGAKIRLWWSHEYTPEFATASELRDSLLASYPNASVTGVPLVGKDRDGTAPAWGWVEELVRKRSDWWPALGIALQHAATDGGAHAQTALAELVGHYFATLALVPWTAPLAERWADRRTVTNAATNWGHPDYRLDAIVRDQRNLLGKFHAAPRQAWLNGYGPGGQPLTGPLTNEAELCKVLTASAHAGQSPGGGTGPWSWLADKLVLGEAWMRPALVHVAQTLDHEDQAVVCALLDWFVEEHDLWRFVELLDSWHSNPPAWWSTPADVTPSGWKRNMRSAHWPEVRTLGDVATEALRRAKWQVVTPPIVDLPQLYGPSIS